MARTYARAIVALRYPVAVLWIGAVVAAAVLLPGLGGSGSAPLTDIVPEDAKALGAAERAVERFGGTLATDYVVVQRNPRGLSKTELTAQLDAVLLTNRRVPVPGLTGIEAAVPLVNVPLPDAEWRETGTTALTYLFLDPDLSLGDRDRAAYYFKDHVLKSEAGSTTGVTGAGPARIAQYAAIDDMLGPITVATVLLILLIVSLYFRSIGAPLVTLATAGIAYVLAIHVLGWSSRQAGITAPSEIEPVLVVLLLGLVTDYTVFFLSETRRSLLTGLERLPAARQATARIAPIVLTAGVLVAGGALALLAGDMQFFRAFGPGLALSALVVTLVSVTLVPALVAIFGLRLFGSRVRAAARAPVVDEADVNGGHPVFDESEKRERWRLRLAGPLGALRASRRQAGAEGGRSWSRFGSRMIVTRPVAGLLAVACVATLAVAALGARSSDLTVSFLPSLAKDSPPRVGADAAAAGFVPGVLAPTDVVLEQAGLDGRERELGRLQDLLARQPGVAAVLGPGTVPVEQVRDVVIARDGGAARFVLFLSDEATGADAIARLKRIQVLMPALVAQAGLSPGARVTFAGETALAAETIDALTSDLVRVGIVAALVCFLLLAIFLRALVAPLLLLFGSVLAFAGAFGLTALLMPHTIGGSDFTYYVPLVAAVLLVGLGSDYNVFIAGRIRDEAGRRRTREAIAIAAPAASKAITVAGITLAATFALLALVPLRPFRELAMVLTIGVLIDALLVRPLLIPTLIAAFGRRAWWPASPRRRPDAELFVEVVARRSAVSVDEARTATRATLCTLAERIPPAETREMASYLPEPLVPDLDGGTGRPQAFDAQEFVERVARRAHVAPAEARAEAAAVLETLIDALPPEEVDYIRAALSEDYRELLGDPVAAEASGARHAHAG